MLQHSSGSPPARVRAAQGLALLALAASLVARSIVAPHGEDELADARARESRPAWWARRGLIRIRLTTDALPGAAFAVTAPRDQPERPALRPHGRLARRTLIHPNVLLYFPCARLPLLERGTVETADELLTWPNGFGPFSYQATSPFLGVVDLYDLDCPVAKKDEPDVLVHFVDRRMPGAIEAPATSTTS